jgi:hypothetical protein
MTTTDTPIPVTSAELESIEREEAEALERMAMREPAPEPAPAPVEINAILTEIEKLAAADVVHKLRHADATAREHTEIERGRIAQAGRRLAAELMAGAAKLERYRPDDEVPEYLREGSVTPLARRQAPAFVPDVDDEDDEQVAGARA